MHRIVTQHRGFCMYRAVITDLGRARLEEADNSSMYRALAALAPSLEAAHPRALFDAFCLRLNERMAAPRNIDEYRTLWRAVRDDGLITVRGSLQIDAGRAFALTGLLSDGSRPRWSGIRDGTMQAARDVAAAPMQDVPLIPQPVSNFFRDILARLLGVARGK